MGLRNGDLESLVDNVFEIDTSTNEINNCAEMILDIINGNIKSNKRIDSSETIMDWY